MTSLAASALRSSTVGNVAGAISLYAERHGVAVGPVAPAAEPGPNDVAVFSPVHRWVVVRWFAFAPHLPASLELSALLATTVIAADVYDRDLWRNVAMERGDVVDRFCSDRRYFSDDMPLGEQWAGRPEVVRPIRHR